MFHTAVGRLRLLNVRQNNAKGGIHFDLSSQDPERIMVRPGRAHQYGRTFFEMLREIAPSLPIVGPKIKAAINDKAIDDLLSEDITV
jgi:hypothetical protein